MNSLNTGMPRERQGKVAVVGAGQCGRMTAQRVAESDVFKTVALTDVIDGLAEGIALDINQSRAIVGFETTVVGRTTRNGDRGDESITEAEIVVVAAGVAPGPEWSLRRLIRENGLIIRRVSEAIARQAPDAVVIVMTNPVDVMTALAGASTGFPSHRVIGQSVLLDTARFADFVAGPLAVPRSSVTSVTIGSHAHDRSMILLLSGATVGTKPLTSLLSPAQLSAAIAATRRGGADVARLLGTHSSFYAPSAAAARMVRAVKDDDGSVLPVCAFLDGAYGIRDVWLGVPARLGRKGVQDIIELPLTDEENRELVSAAVTMRAEQEEAYAIVLNQCKKEGGIA